MAFLLFYLRFATAKIFRNLVYCTMALNTLSAVSTWTIYCLQCIPLDAYFHPELHPTVKCLDKSILAFVPAAFVSHLLHSMGKRELTEQNVFIDILIVVLPIRPLWKIQVSLRKRLMLISIVSLGAIVVLISSLRMIVLQEFQRGTDFTYTLGKLIIISSIEIDVAIIAANGPSLKTFWSRFISRSMKTKTSTGYGTTGNKLSDLSSHRKRTMVSQASCQAMNDFTLPVQGASESAEELRKNDSAIVVTSSVGVERSSAESHERGDVYVQETYNHFGDV